MENWFPLLVVVSHIAIFHFYAVPCGVRLMYQGALNRNPAWVTEHPEFTAENPAPRLSLWISYALGFSLYAWLVFVADYTSEWVLIYLIAASGLLVLLHHSVYFARVRRINRSIPAPAIREASLDRRALRDFLPMGWVYAGVVMIAAIYTVYTYAFLAEIIPGELFFRRTSGVSVACLIATAAMLYCLCRKPTDADELFSGRYRTWEVRANVAVFYLLVLAGGWRILGDVFDVYVGTDLGVIVAISIALQCVVVWASRNEVIPVI
jgi:hypothetical protein